VTPIGARLDATGNRIYTWHGRGYPEEFYSVTTIIGLGVPKYLAPWAAKLVAELAYGDVLAKGPHSRASAIVKRWAKEGAAYVTAQREAGMKLDKVKLTDSQDMALRYLKGQPDRVRDAAGERGTRVHEASEEFVLDRAREGARMYQVTGELPPWTPDIASHMDSFVRFINDFRPRYISTEATVFSRADQYAGTCDAFMEVRVDGRWFSLAVDYKSGRGIYPEVALQCSAYRHGEFVGGADQVTEHPVPVTDGTAVLHLTPKGYKFRLLRDDDATYRTFLYAREIFRWAIDLSKTALGDTIQPDLEDALAASLEVAV
jgi:hypothetical protein